MFPRCIVQGDDFGIDTIINFPLWWFTWQRYNCFISWSINHKYGSKLFSRSYSCFIPFSIRYIMISNVRRILIIFGSGQLHFKYKTKKHLGLSNCDGWGWESLGIFDTLRTQKRFKIHICFPNDTRLISASWRWIFLYRKNMRNLDWLKIYV